MKPGLAPSQTHEKENEMGVEPGDHERFQMLSFSDTENIPRQPVTDQN